MQQDDLAGQQLPRRRGRASGKDEQSDEKAQAEAERMRTHSSPIGSTRTLVASLEHESASIFSFYSVSSKSAKRSENASNTVFSISFAVTM